MHVGGCPAKDDLRASVYGTLQIAIRPTSPVECAMLHRVMWSLPRDCNGGPSGMLNSGPLCCVGRSAASTCIYSLQVWLVWGRSHYTACNASRVTERTLHRQSPFAWHKSSGSRDFLAGSDVDNRAPPAELLFRGTSLHDPKAKCGPLHHPTRGLLFSPHVPCQPTAGPTAPASFSTTIGSVPAVRDKHLQLTCASIN